MFNSIQLFLKKLSLHLIREVTGLQQEEYVCENRRYNKYFLMDLDIRSKEQRLGNQNLAL